MITNDLAPIQKIRTALVRIRDEAHDDKRFEDTVVLTHAIAWLHRLLPVEQRGEKDIPKGNKIFAYLHCWSCLEEMQRIATEQGSVSPKLYARYELGWTKIGFQARCARHDANILHVDLEGAVHPALVGEKR